MTTNKLQWDWNLKKMRQAITGIELAEDKEEFEGELQILEDWIDKVRLGGWYDPREAR